MRWFRQAITGTDNRTIDPSFLVVMFTVFGILPMVIVILCGLSGLDIWLNKHEAAVGALGGGIAAVIASVGALIASCAAILYQDRKPSAPATTTTESQSTVVKTVVPAAAPVVADTQSAQAMQDAGRGVEPLRPAIGPEDVGKSVAIVSKPKRRRKK
jgi:hypothetical protein